MIEKLLSFTDFIRSDQTWMIHVFLVVLATVFVHYIETRFYKKLHVRLKKTPSIWDEALVTSFHKPLGAIIWLVGLSHAIELTDKYTADFVLFEFIPPLRQAGIILLIVWFLLRFIKMFEKNYLLSRKDGPVDITTANAIAQILRVSVIITGVLIILPIFDIKITGLLAVGGAGTLIVGLAAQDLLANLFGAMTIFMDRPFAVGDWIRSPDRQLEGTVEYIGWRLTRIRTFDKRPLYVPNSVFTKIAVENPSRMSNRRIKEIVGIRYQDAAQLPAITKDIKDMLMNHEEIDTGAACYVNLVSFGPSSLDIEIYTFTKTTAWIPYQGIKQAIMMEILTIITKHGGEVAFPTRTVEIPDGLALER